jgi:hypothetical protein
MHFLVPMFQFFQMTAQLRPLAKFNSALDIYANAYQLCHRKKMNLCRTCIVALYADGLHGFPHYWGNYSDEGTQK